MLRERVVPLFGGRLSSSSLLVTTSQPSHEELCVVGTPRSCDVTRGDAAIVSVEYIKLPQLGVHEVPAARTDEQAGPEPRLPRVVSVSASASASASAAAFQLSFALHPPYPSFHAAVCDAIPGVTLFNTGSAVLMCSWDGTPSGPLGWLAADDGSRQRALPGCLQLSHIAPIGGELVGCASALQLRFDADSCVRSLQVGSS